MAVTGCQCEVDLTSNKRNVIWNVCGANNFLYWC